MEKRRCLAGNVYNVCSIPTVRDLPDFSDASLTTTNSTNTWTNFLENTKIQGYRQKKKVWCLLFVFVLLPVISSVFLNPSSCLISFGLNHSSCSLAEISPHCYNHSNSTTTPTPAVLFYICSCLNQRKIYHEGKLSATISPPRAL